MTTREDRAARAATRMEALQAGAARGGRWMETLLLGAWAAFLLATPFYLLPSGYPQLGDMIFVLVPMLLILDRGLLVLPSFRTPMRVMAVGVLYAIAVNILWTVLTGLVEIATFGLYFAYNGVVFAGVLLLYARVGERLRRVTMPVLVLGLLIQVVIVLVEGRLGAHRETAFFDKPNQLGYFGVLTTTIYLLVRARGGRRNRSALAMDAVVVGGTFLLAVAAASRASLAAGGVAAIVLAVILLRRARRPGLVVFTYAMVGALLLLTPPEYYAGWSSAEAFTKLRERLLAAELMSAENPLAEALEGRGYERFEQYPRLAVLGAGEGANDRFVRVGKAPEIHSTVGALLFSYGVPGLLWLLLLLLLVQRRSGFLGLACLFPAFVYGLSHNGLRDSLFWVSLAFAMLPPAVEADVQDEASPEEGEMVVGAAGAGP